MSRPLRLEYPGALWHVTSRGVERRDIYLDDADRRWFLALLARVVERYRWIVHAYVLMTNHYHLLIETPIPTLSRGMQMLGGEFAEFFNVRHCRAGHLFQGRFKAHLVEKESYLLEVARYIVLNPVRAKMVECAREWPWSSYRATAGMESVPSWLMVQTILEHFDPWDSATAADLYRQFVAEGVGGESSPWEKLVAQAYLGGEEFLAGVQEKLAKRDLSAEHRFDQKNVVLATLDQVREIVLEVWKSGGLSKSGGEDVRQAFALLGRREALGKLAEIGRMLHVRESGARYLIRCAEERERSDRLFGDRIERARVKISYCELQM